MTGEHTPTEQRCTCHKGRWAVASCPFHTEADYDAASGVPLGGITREPLVVMIHRERCGGACPPHPVDHGIASVASAWFRERPVPAPDDQP